MKKAIMKQWVAALRSGEFHQGKNKLYNPKENSHCCLGVLSDLALVNGVCDYEENNGEAIYNGKTNAHFLCESVMKWSGIKSDRGVAEFSGLGNISLSILNDEGVSFEEIANIIEKNYKKL